MNALLEDLLLKLRGRKIAINLSHIRDTCMTEIDQDCDQFPSKVARQSSLQSATNNIDVNMMSRKRSEAHVC